jgi:hypothetical protein
VRQVINYSLCRCVSVSPRINRDVLSVEGRHLQSYQTRLLHGVERNSSVEVTPWDTGHVATARSGPVRRPREGVSEQNTIQDMILAIYSTSQKRTIEGIEVDRGATLRKV